MSIVRENGMKIKIKDNFQNTNKKELIFLKKEPFWRNEIFFVAAIFYLIIIIYLILRLETVDDMNTSLALFTILIGMVTLILAWNNDIRKISDNKHQLTLVNSDSRLLRVVKVDIKFLYIANDGKVDNFAAVMDNIVLNDNVIKSHEYRINYLKCGKLLKIKHSLKLDGLKQFSLYYRIVPYDRRSCTFLNISQSMKLDNGEYLPICNTVKVKKISYNY